jgi:tRNA G10  N-methylase Trm11
MKCKDCCVVSKHFGRGAHVEIIELKALADLERLMVWVSGHKEQHQNMPGNE